MSEPSEPSYAELAARVEVQDRVIAELRALVSELQGEVAALRRQVGRDSSNSSQPPSKDGLGSTPRTPRPSGGRARGGQPGRRGSGLERVAVPDRVCEVEPEACGGCGAGLAGAAGEIASTVQVFDIPPVAVSVTEYLMMRRTCAGCGHTTTAAPPAGVAGPTCYGPNVVAATTLLAASDVIGIERAADLMGALLGAPVSTGFVSRCLARLDGRLVRAGFEEELKDRLRAAAVIATDETPVNVAEEASKCYVYTVRTTRSHTGGGADLVWYGAAASRGHDAIDSFALLPGHTGVLVRDDYGGYTRHDAHLAGVQQCCAHLLRALTGVHAIDPQAQAWAEQAARALREAGAAVTTARATGATHLDPDLLARARRDYDQAIAVGISANLSRPWRKGENHPGLVLARRLQRKADQVWLFTTRFDVPWTNNASEQAVRGFKVNQKISGCWRTLTTLQRHCRIRSYLTTASNHAIKALDAIRDALTANPWMPPQTA